jgi:hypothetical protein
MASVALMSLVGSPFDQNEIGSTARADLAAVFEPKSFGRQSRRGGQRLDWRQSSLHEQRELCMQGGTMQDRSGACVSSRKHVHAARLKLF